MRKTVANQLRAGFLRIADHVAQDFARYRADPVLFAKECLFTEVWGRQADILRAIATSDRVTVATGRRIGKTCLDAIAALWFWRTRGPGCRVILTAPKMDQVQDQVWREIRLLHQGAKRGGRDLGGDLAVLCTTGLRDEDGREIIGVTAEQPEKLQGYAAREIMFIVDEASKVEDRNLDVIFGNLAGGGKLVMTGNPTRSEGHFYNSHKKFLDFVKFQLSSTESPNVVAGRIVIPGLATKPWVDEMAAKWGAPDGPFWRIHVLGQFVEGIEGFLFPPTIISVAQTVEASPSGPLIVSCDPAGDGGDGDQAGFAARRGMKVFTCYGRQGLRIEAQLLEAVGLIQNFRGGSWEIPRLIYDRDGPVGARFHAEVEGYLQKHKDAFFPVPVRSSDNARKRPLEVYHIRDELWLNLADLMKTGRLSIPADSMLEGDLAVIRSDKLTETGRAKVIGKREIRKILGRSPDLGDALALVCYDGPAFVDENLQDMKLEEYTRGRSPMPTIDEQARSMGASSLGCVYDMANQAMGGGGYRRDD